MQLTRRGIGHRSGFPDRNSQKAWTPAESQAQSRPGKAQTHRSGIARTAALLFATSAGRNRTARSAVDGSWRDRSATAHQLAIGSRCGCLESRCEHAHIRFSIPGQTPQRPDDFQRRVGGRDDVSGSAQLRKQKISLPITDNGLVRDSTGSVAATSHHSSTGHGIPAHGEVGRRMDTRRL
jgi:hypothetical protein